MKHLYLNFRQKQQVTGNRTKERKEKEKREKRKEKNRKRKREKKERKEMKRKRKKGKKGIDRRKENHANTIIIMIRITSQSTQVSSAQRKYIKIKVFSLPLAVEI